MYMNVTHGLMEYRVKGLKEADFEPSYKIMPNIS